MSAAIDVRRARESARLVGEVHELGAKTEEGRAHFVKGLLRLVGAQIGGAVRDDAYAPGLTHGITGVTLVHFDDDLMEVFSTHHTRGSAFNPFHLEAMNALPALARGEVLTMTNECLVANDAWNRSTWVNDYARPAHVDHFLGSCRRTGEKSVQGVGLMRSVRDRPFTEEDREVVHLCHLGLGRFFVPATDDAPQLAPRVRQTLEALLSGAADKDIAHRLGISHHTVRQYVKVIYKAYGVSSRAELIAREVRKSSA